MTETSLPASSVERGRIHWWATTPIWVLHVLPFLAFFTGVPWWNWVLMAGLYFGRMFFITAGYHRYFAHRAYKTSRWFQFVLAVGGATAAQKGPLWWAGNHRLHHRYVDTDRDAHTPIKGFWWAHLGWILSDAHDETPTESIEDFAKYPELRFLNRHDWIPVWTLGALTWWFAGWSGFLIGFVLSTVLLWHCTFMVNSVVHMVGTRRYATNDTSRNNLPVALLTLGEGWHNNHHYYPVSARQGFFWFEPDVSYTILRGLSWLGIVRDLRLPPAEVRQGMRIKDGNVDIGMLHHHFRAIGDVLDDARTPSYDVTHPEVDAAKTRLELGLAEIDEAATQLRRLDRKRRRGGSAATEAAPPGSVMPDATELSDPAGQNAN